MRTREHQKTVTIGSDPWAALAAETVKPGRPHPNAKTLEEVATEILGGVSTNAARNWAEKKAKEGAVELIQGRSEKNNRTTLYVLPANL